MQCRHIHIGAETSEEEIRKFLDGEDVVKFGEL
jgi:hypothetical protein